MEPLTGPHETTRTGGRKRRPRNQILLNRRFIFLEHDLLLAIAIVNAPEAFAVDHHGIQRTKGIFDRSAMLGQDEGD